MYCIWGKKKTILFFRRFKPLFLVKVQGLLLFIIYYLLLYIIKKYIWYTDIDIINIGVCYYYMEINK